MIDTNQMIYFTYIAFMRHKCISNYIIYFDPKSDSYAIRKTSSFKNTNNNQKLVYGFITSTHLPTHYRIHSRATNLKQSTTK